MNSKTNEQRLGVSLIFMGLGIYLPVLELVRLINHFEARLGTLASTIYLTGCFVCTILITAGIILVTVRRAGIVVASILGIVSFWFVGIALFYCAYLIPYFQHQRYQVSDWLLVSSICLAGILFVVGGWFNVTKRE